MLKERSRTSVLEVGASLAFGAWVLELARVRALRRRGRRGRRHRRRTVSEIEVHIRGFLRARLGIEERTRRETEHAGIKIRRETPHGGVVTLHLRIEVAALDRNPVLRP